MGVRHRLALSWAAVFAILALLLLAWSLGWFGGGAVPPSALKGTVPQAG